MDQAAQDHWAGLLGDWEAQLREANLSGGFNVNCDRYFQRHHSGFRLSTEFEDDYWNRHKGFV
jgi:hypothetical protein